MQVCVQEHADTMVLGSTRQWSKNCKCQCGTSAENLIICLCSHCSHCTPECKNHLHTDLVNNIHEHLYALSNGGMSVFNWSGRISVFGSWIGQWKLTCIHHKFVFNHRFVAREASKLKSRIRSRKIPELFKLNHTTILELQLVGKHKGQRPE